MTTWELVPKIDRPDAQVLITLPNAETEFIDGFRYQEFRESEGGGLVPAGPPHTRYRYLPRRAGTYTWQHRTPPGGFLEQGAFLVEAGCSGAAAPSLPDGGPPPQDLLSLPLPMESEELAGLGAAGEMLDRAARECRFLRVPLDDAESTVVLPGGEPDLARQWLLDAVLRAAEERGVGVILRLPPPAGPETSQLYAALFLYVCRYSAMPALAAWEVPVAGPTGEAAHRFLRAYDPHHPVMIVKESP